MKTRTLLLLLAAIALNATSYAQVPPLLNYQGRVVVGTTNFNGTGQFKFALVNGSNGATLWRNHGTGAGEPANAVSIAVSNGLYSVLLGDTTLTNMAAIPATVFNNSDVRLRVWFNNGANGSQQLTPDQRIAAVGYAIIAGNVPDGAISSGKIASGAITAAKIAGGAVGQTQLSAGAVGATQLLSLAPPGAGQVLGFDGSSLNWTAPGSGDGIWLLNGGDAIRSSGNVGIGTNVPAAKLELRTGTSFYGFLHSDGTTKLGSYIGNSTSGASGGWLGTLSNHPLHLFVNNGQPAATLSTGGNFGLGTSAPGARLHLYNPTATVGEVIETGGATNSQSVLGFKNLNGQWNSGTSRGFNNDVFFIDRLGNTPLEFQLSATGALGLGIEPQAKLHLYDPVSSVSQRIQTNGGTNAWTRVEFTNPNGQWNLGTSRGFNGDQFYIYREGASGVAFAVQPNGDASINGKLSVGAGDAVQARDKGGFVKAMSFIDPFLPASQYVVRCYNSQQAGSATSTAPCGIRVTREGEGVYTIDFGFNVEDRFFSVTSREKAFGVNGLVAGTIRAVIGNQVFVAFSQIGDPQEGVDSRFYLIVN